MRCIAKDPAQRYTTMDDVLQAIKRAHGGSMTGQLAAVNISGAYAPIGTVPPPAVHSSVPGFAPAQTAAGTSGTHTPMGVMQAHQVDASGESGAGAYSEAPPRRSKAWIGVGVLVAAVLGGLLGMAAFRVTSTSLADGASTASPTIPEPRPATTEPSPGRASPTTSGSAAGSSAALPTDVRTATLHITSDPPGASVREEATELCAATPCDVTFKGEAADPAKVHKLLFTHLGFRPETRSVKAGDPPLQVKLLRGGGGRPVFTAPPTPSTKPTETTTNGFKDIPY